MISMEKRKFYCLRSLMYIQYAVASHKEDMDKDILSTILTMVATTCESLLETAPMDSKFKKIGNANMYVYTLCDNNVLVVHNSTIVISLGNALEITVIYDEGKIKAFAMINNKIKQTQIVSRKQVKDDLQYLFH